MSTQGHGGTTVIVQQQNSNGLGTAGFVISLIGFLTCGCISPIGLLLSCLGLLKPPRGLALAGSILGAIGSAWLWLFGFAMIAGFAGLGSAIDKANERKAEIDASPTPLNQPAETPAIVTDQPQDPVPFTPLQIDPVPNDVPANKPIEIKPDDGSVDPGVLKRLAEPEKPIPSAEFREFKSLNGTFTVRARFITKSRDDKVQLRREDTGKIITVPLDQLSEPDREWISEKLKAAK